jgi:membrane protein DedA with SNARE-associated domain
VLERLADLVLDPGIPPALVYAMVLVSCVLESFFPPWPADLVSLYAGFLAGRGLVATELVFAVAVAGTQAGVMAAFFLSRRWGRGLLAGPAGRYIPVGRLQTLEAWFARWGAPAIAVSRFFPGIRALVMPAAGLAGFAAWRVWVYAGVSVLIWNALVVGLGVFAGTHMDWAEQVLFRYNTVAGAIVGIAALALALRLAYRRHTRP